MLSVILKLAMLREIPTTLAFSQRSLRRTKEIYMIQEVASFTAGDRIRTDDVQLGKLAFYH